MAIKGTELLRDINKSIIKQLYKLLIHPAGFAGFFQLKSNLSHKGVKKPNFIHNLWNKFKRL